MLNSNLPKYYVARRFLIEPHLLSNLRDMCDELGGLNSAGLDGLDDWGGRAKKLV